MNSDPFTYVFPAIKGVQAGRSYFVTMCPLRLLSRLFLFDDSELPADMRAQRSLDLRRIPEMAAYMVDNPKSYIFSALTASISSEVRFTPTGGIDMVSERIGLLQIPMDARLVINDGQHRRAAILEALELSPELGDETIAIVLFVDQGLKRCQQMFADLNRYAVKPSPSLGVLYDHRDETSEITRRMVAQSRFFRQVTELEKSSLAKRSSKLFTLSSLNTANLALLKGLDDLSIENRLHVVSEFWEHTSAAFKNWQAVYRGEEKASVVRSEYINTHALILHALAIVGNSNMDRHGNFTRLDQLAQGISEIDWRRDNTRDWEGRAMVDGVVSKSRKSLELTVDFLEEKLTNKRRGN